jgi:hypothetical protein
MASDLDRLDPDIDLDELLAEVELLDQPVDWTWAPRGPLVAEPILHKGQPLPKLPTLEWPRAPIAECHVCHRTVRCRVDGQLPPDWTWTRDPETGAAARTWGERRRICRPCQNTTYGWEDQDEAMQQVDMAKRRSSAATNGWDYTNPAAHRGF